MKSTIIKRIMTLFIAVAVASSLASCGGDDTNDTESTVEESSAVVSTAPATEAPVTEAPATEPPETDPPIVIASWDEIIENSLDRSAWSATASHSGSPAMVKKAYDDNIDTRWDTNTVQVPDMFFTLDLGSEQTFNYILLDVGASTNDGPADYEVYTSSDGETWSDCLAEGYKDDIIKLSSTQTAKFIKILVTGEDPACYWSIHEMYVSNVPEA